MKRIDAWSEKMYSENKSIFQLLKEIVGNLAVSTINYQHAKKYQNILLDLSPNRTKGKYAGKSVKQLLAMRTEKKLAVKTVNKNLRRTSGLFVWGVKNRYISENPFSGMKLKDKRQAHEERERFDANDLIRLFNTEVFDRDKFKHPYYFWLPYLGLYTGARIEELCQLHSHCRRCQAVLSS